jgi:hypothetical protein
MAGYDGLALSLYDRNAQSFEDLGAVNMFSITVSDATTITSGYIQAFYANVTSTGSKTGGNATQVNAFAADVFFGGTVTSQVSGMYVYMAESGTATMTDAQLDGYVVFLGSVGSAAVYRSGFHAYSEEPTATNASGLDAGLIVECAGATGTWGAVIGVMGVTKPLYFLQINNAPGEERMFSTGARGNVAAAAAWLACNVNGTVYQIALHATCTS